MNLKLLIFPLFLLIFSGCGGETPIAIIDLPTNEDGSGIIINFEDYMGNQARNTIFSEQIVAKRLDDVAVQFQYDISDFDVIITTVDTGRVFQADSQAIISTGIGLNAEAHIESVEAVRYRPGHEAYGMFTAAFVNGGVENVEQAVGIFNELEDGYGLGFNNTDFVAGLVKGGVRDFVTQDEFMDKLDGTGDSGCVIDFTKLHIYRISFGWLGIAPITYEVYCGSNIGWVNFFTMDKNNLQNTPTINNPVLPVQMHIIKTGAGTTENVTIRTSSWAGGIIDGGSIQAGTRSFSTFNEKTISANVLTNILTIKSNQTFFGHTNRIDLVLEYISAATDGNKDVKLFLYKNANLGGSPSYTSLDINNSVVLVDISGTTVSGGTLQVPFGIAKVGQINEVLTELFIDLHKNETLTIAALSTGSNEVFAGLRWDELY